MMLILAGIALWLDRAPTRSLVADASVRKVDIKVDIKGDIKVDITPGTLYSARFTDFTGTTQELGQWQRKLLVINFWATWCGPCKDEMPMLSRIHDKYKSDGLQIIGIAVDSRENVANFSEKMPMSYPLYADESRAMEFSKRLGNRLGLLPFTVVIRPGGEIIFSRMGIVHESEMVELATKNMPK